MDSSDRAELIRGTSKGTIVICFGEKGIGVSAGGVSSACLLAAAASILHVLEDEDKNIGVKLTAVTARAIVTSALVAMGLNNAKDVYKALGEGEEKDNEGETWKDPKPGDN